jgi:hypothetical protein
LFCLPLKKLQLSIGTLNIELTPNTVDVESCLLSPGYMLVFAAVLALPPTMGEEPSDAFLLREIM